MKNSTSLSKKNKTSNVRHYIVLMSFTVLAIILIGRLLDLRLDKREFLISKAHKQYVKIETMPAHRGRIFDRNGELLAISVKSKSVYVRPKEFITEKHRWAQLEKLLNQKENYLTKRVEDRMSLPFVYLQPRSISPQVFDKINSLNLKGLFFEDSFTRFYPSKNQMSHLIGFSGDDQRGQEGLELLYDHVLSGKPGSRKVYLDAKKNIFKEPKIIDMPTPGSDLTLTVDQRIQYIAARAADEFKKYHEAKAVSIFIVDVFSGDVLAMANSPTFNPNNIKERTPNNVRNRSMTDTFEPGSTIKPFTISAALSTQQYDTNTKVNTPPGHARLGSWPVKDAKDFGVLTVRQILEKSSNIGAIRISNSIKSAYFWQLLNDVGFGNQTGIMWPGESSGKLNFFEDWHSTEKASLTFGYGMSVTIAQLARAYMVFANGGCLLPLRLIKGNNYNEKHQVLDSKISEEIKNMLVSAVQFGTGKRSKVSGYLVAGKTGTVRKIASGSYEDDAHLALYAGIFPASNPKVVGVVMVDNPIKGGSSGGEVAAPIFSKVMAQSARFLNISKEKKREKTPYKEFEIVKKPSLSKRS